MPMIPRTILFLALSFLLCCLNSSSAPLNVSYDSRAILINGERKILLSGSIHYPRSTAEMWPGLVQKAKEGGLDAIDTYVFWNAHEPERREYDFKGDLDLVKFIKVVKDAGLYAILRIGPYACAEWNYGGLPVWLQQIPGVEFRTDNKIFKDEMQTFTTLIVDMMKKENLFAPQGGPIIITQIENEYGNVMDAYGDAGKTYIQWCATMAESLNVGVPWIMCQQADAPSPMINTCNGFYCHKFTPNNPNSPKMWTENWTGWFQAWGHSQPHRPAEDVAYAVAAFFESGGTFQNYYMYHGGTNFGHSAGGPMFVTSYDYDAPLDEYGYEKQPKWGHLKQLHSALKKMEKALTDGVVNTTLLGNALAVTKYTGDTEAGCFLVNANQSADANIEFGGNQYFLPARSYSILPDCKTEIYNTAKVNTQTSLLVKKPMVEGQKPLSWTWKPEQLKLTLDGKGSFQKTQLLEQIMVTGDASDYLWYMTSVNLPQDVSSWENATIQVNTAGHVLHAYVNDDLVGSQYGSKDNLKFVFEGAVDLVQGENTISLLSATVGLANYQARYELQPTGLVGGSVRLIGKGNAAIDLTNSTWSYKIGLNGEDKFLFLPSPPQKLKLGNWRTEDLPTNRSLVWYRTTFDVQEGEDALVLDLQGMGKGEAWVNGKSIGRFWPSFIAATNTCQPCDYRTQFQDSACRTGCGEPSQRWYHVPRSYATVGPNYILVLFEEFGGNPSNVNFQTVVVGTVCANALEGSTLELSCQGKRTFSEIKFASFGDPKGSCDSFEKGTCEASDSLEVVKKACLGQSKCSINVAANAFSESGCSGVTKRLAVQAVC